MRHLLFLVPLIAAAQPEITFERNVVYNQGGRLMMDIVHPETAGLRPAVVAVRGTFAAADRAGLTQTIGRLAQAGYVAAAIDYRVAPRNQFPAPVQDVKAAIRFLRANAQKYLIDPERIAIVGYQDAGMLALLAALTPGVAEFEAGPNREQSSRVNCVVSLDSPAAPPGSPETAQLLGGSPANNRAAYAWASPLSWITPQAPPLLAGGKDARHLVEAWRGSGAAAEIGSETGMRAFLDTHLGMTPPKQVVLLSDHGGRGQIVAIDWPSGRELWTVPNRSGHDVQPLPDGHVLYTLGNDHKVVEMDAAHKQVWTYGAEEGLQHPISAERLPNGNTLIGDAQLGRVIEVDKDRKIVWKYESADLAGMRSRNVRRTAAGTTLISVEAAGKIIEVNRAGETVWSYTGEGGPKRRPYRAVRLPNGNTLITLNDPGELVEVTPAGKVVRSIAGEQDDIRMIWASGFDLFPGGNILLSDYQGHRVVEIDKDGKVVHEVRIPTRSTASVAVVK